MNKKIMILVGVIIIAFIGIIIYKSYCNAIEVSKLTPAEFGSQLEKE